MTGIQGKEHFVCDVWWKGVLAKSVYVDTATNSVSEPVHLLELDGAGHGAWSGEYAASLPIKVNKNKWYKWVPDSELVKVVESSPRSSSMKFMDKGEVCGVFPSSGTYADYGPVARTAPAPIGNTDDFGIFTYGATDLTPRKTICIGDTGGTITLHGAIHNPTHSTTGNAGGLIDGVVGTATIPLNYAMISESTHMSSMDSVSYYGGKDNPYEAIKVIEAWGLEFALGNVLKYISRAGKKDKAKKLEDLKKAKWYLEREIQNTLLEEKS